MPFVAWKKHVLSVRKVEIQGGQIVSKSGWFLQNLVWSKRLKVLMTMLIWIRLHDLKHLWKLKLVTNSIFLLLKNIILLTEKKWVHFFFQTSDLWVADESWLRFDRRTGAACRVKDWRRKNDRCQATESSFLPFYQHNLDCFHLVFWG